jgi:hypothetical protein
MAGRDRSAGSIAGGVDWVLVALGLSAASVVPGVGIEREARLHPALPHGPILQLDISNSAVTPSN